MIPKECGAVPMDAATRADLIDLMARVLVAVFHEEGRRDNDRGLVQSQNQTGASGSQGDRLEEPQRAHDLVQRRPRDPRRNQMNLEGVDIFQAQTIRGATKIPAELRYGAEVRLLRRRRQIADRHVLDHTAAKRAGLNHRKTSCLKGWVSKNP